ncbi:Zn(2)-C6 fungal-type domain-containing protein [Favolaschia claudopus]|uniref:Zn(2)-C6 fungal-type domain-containing protein n=1 Tax=Favolaschia claudopus TaxID=2862362 RepID=A0AAW0AAL8_9AGAR
MSDPSIPTPGSKKRRLQGACDICRSKKSDSAKMPNNICSNCIAFDSKCTHLASAANRRPGVSSGQPSQPAVQEQLHRPTTPIHSRIEAILSPQYTLPTDSASILRTLVELATYAKALEQELAGFKTVLEDAPIADSSTAYTRPPTPTDLTLTATDGCVLIDLNERMRGLMINSSHNRFYGQSSDIMLVKMAMDVKRETGEDKKLADHLVAIKRPEYWETYPWHQPPPEPEDIYIFPEKDLMDDLIQLFFTHVHPFIALLHRQTFEKSVREGLHLRDSRFGATLLLVCALAARYSSDPRVYLEGTNQSNHSCGWRWAGQIRFVKQSFTTTPSLYDVQICCLSVIFLQGTGCPELCWVLTSIGIRLAQDVGAHRRRRYTGDKPAEDQLWTRAFWVLVCIDILLSASFGRPRATTADDFDLDLPVECDDEYWDGPEPFKQPPEKPSELAYVNCYIKLLDILGFAQRTLYTLKRSKKRGTEAEQWNRQVVAEIEYVKALFPIHKLINLQQLSDGAWVIIWSGAGLLETQNNWIDALPEHLKWNPHREDSTFAQQSASLYASYYHVQIQVHRPFIPVPGRSSPLAYASLAVCASAARSCSHFMAQSQILPLAHVMMALFDSSVILMLIVWSGKRNGLSLDTSKEIRDVHSNLRIFQTLEGRWQIAGRLWDTIYAMLSAGDFLESKAKTPPSLKRDRDSETPSTDLGHSISASSYSPHPSPGGTSSTGSDSSSVKPPSLGHPHRYSVQQNLEDPPLERNPSAHLPVHPPMQPFEISNPFVPNAHFSIDNFVSDGMDGWSEAFLPQPENDPLSQKVLPSDFFSSIVDNTLGTTEGEPAWAYASATDITWTNWDQHLQGGIHETPHF